MSLVIRLARAGTKKRPFYHIVVADLRSPRDGRFIERLGYFNPLLPKEKAERLKFDLEKAQAWMKKGAQPSDRVMRFLDAAGVAKREKRNNPEKAVPRKERKAKAEEAAKAQPRRRRQDRGVMLYSRSRRTATARPLSKGEARSSAASGERSGAAEAAHRGRADARSRTRGEQRPRRPLRRARMGCAAKSSCGRSRGPACGRGLRRRWKPPTERDVRD